MSRFLSGGKGHMSGKLKQIPVATVTGDGVEEENAETVSSDGGGKHGSMFYRIIRRHVAKDLAQTHGFDYATAAKMASEVSTAEIDEKADQAGVVGKIGDGSILQWLSDHKQQIIAVITIIVTILAML